MLLWGSYWVYQNKTLGFSVRKISSNFSHNPDWAIQEPKGQELFHLKEILSQKYTYLASGSQSYAFVSADGKYVVKFFRMKHLIPRISDLWRKERIAHQHQNLLSIFGAHKLAYEELREDSGLLYIHLNKTQHLNTRFQAIDKLGRTHWIDLDRTEFVVQEKADLIFKRFKTCLDRGDTALMDQSIAATLRLVQRRIDKGIADHDKAVQNNYGFVGEKPIHIDIGRLYRGDKPHEADRIAARIQLWLEENRSSS